MTLFKILIWFLYKAELQFEYAFEYKSAEDTIFFLSPPHPQLLGMYSKYAKM